MGLQTLMTMEVLKLVLDQHKLWVESGGQGGRRARIYQKYMPAVDLRGSCLANACLSCSELRGCDFSGVDLAGANLSNSNISGSCFAGANLSGARLRRALCYNTTFSGANLTGANFTQAHIGYADFNCANLTGADLSYAIVEDSNIHKANLKDVIVPITLPDGADIVGYKKCIVQEEYQDHVIVKLLIPKEAKRSVGTGEKCRAEYAKVEEVYGAEEAVSAFAKTVRYKSGETVRCHSWDENRWQECSGGIHFFLSREEAEQYVL